MSSNMHRAALCGMEGRAWVGVWVHVWWALNIFTSKLVNVCFLFSKKFKYGNFEYGLFPAFTMRITLVLLVLCEAGCQRECVNRGSE